MFDSLIFALSRWSPGCRYSLTTRAMVRYCVGAIPTWAEKKWVKWLCDEKPSSKPMSVTEVCERREPIERALDAHGVGIERRRYPGILAEQLDRNAAATGRRRGPHCRARYLGQGHHPKCAAICGRESRLTSAVASGGVGRPPLVQESSKLASNN